MSSLPWVAVEEVPISEVVVPSDRLRPLGDVSLLADSIAKVGLLHAIVVSANRVLISGHHRLEACRQLGHDTIAARVLSIDGALATLTEIDENLLQASLTVLERAEHLARRKAVYESLYPDTRHGAAPGVAGGGKRAKDPGPGSFVNDTAKKTHRGRSTIAEETRLGEAIGADVARRLRHTTIANNKRELRLPAGLPVGEQQQVADRLVAGEIKHVREALPPASTSDQTDSHHGGTIFDDVRQLKEATRGLLATEAALTKLLCGWECGPGPDVERILKRLPRMLETVKALRVLLEDEWTPQARCAPCGEEARPQCKTCTGLGWLSKAMTRAAAEISP